MSLFAACNVLYCKGVAYSFFSRTGTKLLARHETEIRRKAGRPTLTLQLFKADLYFELSLYGLRGEKCEQRLRFSFYKLWKGEGEVTDLI